MEPGIYSALGGLGLFLLGMVVMTNSLKELAGDSIRRTIARFTTSPTSGVATGAVITALIQSSSATTVTAVGFAGAGLLTLSQSLGVIFGANIGTTITGWIVAVFGFKIKLGVIALPLVLVGIVTNLFAKGRIGSCGLALAGFGLVFVGIDLLQDGMTGLHEFVTPDTFPPDTWLGRLLLVFIGIAITLVTQSSSAGVAMALAAVHTGTISFPQAAAMVIGFDVGTTVTAAVAAIGGSVEARRVGFAHVVYNMITGIGAFFLLTPYVWACDSLLAGGVAANSELALVGFHTTFNGLGVLLAVPFTRRFAIFIERLIPERSDEIVRRIHRSLYESPSVAIVAARATLVDITRQLLSLMREEFETVEIRETDAEDYEQVRKMLAEVSRFLMGIDCKQDAKLVVRLEDLFLTLDHLRRLSRRCDQFDRFKAVGDDPLLGGYALQVRNEIIGVIAALEDAMLKGPQQSARKLVKSFERNRERDRRLLSQSVVRGDIDHEEAIERLDTLRWLRRISFHLWRITRHLRHAQFDHESSVRKTKQTVAEQIIN